MPAEASATLAAPLGEAAVQSGAVQSGINTAPRFRTGFAWTLAANVIYAACQWGMLACLAKLSSPADVGLFALSLAVTAPFILFSNLQLRAVQATDASGSFSFKEYAGLRLWTTLAALVVLTVIAATHSGQGGAALTIFVLALAKSFESLSDVLQGYMQQRERMDVLARSLIMKGAISLALVAAATVLFRTALAAGIGVAIASALMLAFYDWPVTRKLIMQATSALGEEVAASSSPVRFARLRQLAVIALPLGIVQGLVSLSANIPRYQLERSAGLSDLGIYSALASLIVVGQTAVSALGNVASPRLAKLRAAGNIRGFIRLLLSITIPGAAIGLVGVAVATLYGGPLLTLLFRPEYGAHSNVLVTIMVGACFAYVAWLTGFGLTAARIFRAQIPLLGAVCFSAWVAAFLLVPRYGAVGAAYAFAVSMAIQGIGSIFILWRALRRPVESLA